MNFSLLGFPTSIQGSFLLTVGFLGYLSFADQIDRIIAFVVIAVVAVLVHELGHAVVARRQGTVEVPTITLAGMAGLTRYRPKTEPSRMQSIMVSFAGPFAGMVMGAAILALDWSGAIERTPFVDDLFRIGLFTTFAWSILNLLPILPLDGGHILADLIPGSRAVRRRRAAIVSVLTAGLGALALWQWTGSLFGPIYLAMFAFQNLSAVNAGDRETPMTPPLSVRADSPDGSGPNR